VLSRVLEVSRALVNVVSGHWCSTVVRRVGAPYRRVRIPGLSDLRVCALSANKDIAPRTRCSHLIIQQAIH